MDEPTAADLDLLREDLTGAELQAPDRDLAASDPEAPAAPDPEGALPPTVSLADAARLYRVSESTLRRRLTAGALPGARKLPGPRGDEWHLTIAELESLGYRRGGAAADSSGASAIGRSPRTRSATAEPERPRAPGEGGAGALARLTEALATADQRLQAAQDEREGIDLARQEAVLRAARAEAVLESERHAAEETAQRLRVLEERLDRVTAERDRYAQALTWSGRRRLRRESRTEELQSDERDRFRRAYTPDP